MIKQKKSIFNLPFLPKSKSSISVVDADPTIDINCYNITDDYKSGKKDRFRISLNEIMKEKPKIRKRIKKTLSHFLSVSTIHGLSSLWRAKYLYLKIMWIAFIILSVGGCAFFVTESINSFLDFNYFTLGKVVTVPYMDFPAVTICSSQYTDTALEIKMYNCVFENQECNYTDFNKVTVFDPFYKIQTYCYTFNSGRNIHNEKIELKKAYKSGYNSGLKLNLYNYNKVEKMHIYVTDSEIRPFFERHDIIQSPGTKTNIIFTKSLIKRLGEPYNRCTEIDNVSTEQSPLINQMVKDNHQYQQANCYNLCYYDYLATNCNCTFDASITDLEICFSSECFKDLYNEQDFDYEANCQKNCPLECESSVIFKTFKTSQYPLRKLRSQIVNDIKTKLNKTADEKQLGDRVFEFNFYFLDFTESITEQVPKITISGLVSNIGGTFGLFLGSSLISFVEIIELFIQLLIISKTDNFNTK